MKVNKAEIRVEGEFMIAGGLKDILENHSATKDRVSEQYVGGVPSVLILR